jgi:hypothetical protein
MGYKRSSKVYNLAFDDDGEFAGLEVRVRSMSVGKVRTFLKLRSSLREGESDDAQAATAMDETFNMFAGCLLSWNLEDDAGFPVPATREGIDAQDVDFIMAVISAWMETMTGVPEQGPLDTPSSDGAPFPVGSIPMEPLSRSQAS